MFPGGALRCDYAIMRTARYHPMTPSDDGDCKSLEVRGTVTDYTWIAPDSGTVRFNALCAKQGTAFLAAEIKCTSFTSLLVSFGVSYLLFLSGTIGAMSVAFEDVFESRL